MIKLSVEHSVSEFMPEHHFSVGHEPEIKRLNQRLALKGIATRGGFIHPGDTVYITKQEPITPQELFEKCVGDAKSGDDAALEALPYIAQMYLGSVK